MFNSLFVLFSSCISWFDLLLSRTGMSGYFLAGFTIFTVSSLFLRPILGSWRGRSSRSDTASMKNQDKV